MDCAGNGPVDADLLVFFVWIEEYTRGSLNHVPGGSDAGRRNRCHGIPARIFDDNGVCLMSKTMSAAPSSSTAMTVDFYLQS